MVVINDCNNLIQYLEANEERFLNEWLENIQINACDLHKDNVKENGLSMYLLAKQALTNRITDQEIQNLAFEVIKERTEANVDISEFLSNVNLSRTIITRYVFFSNIDTESVRIALEKLNSCLDRFSYHAIKMYTVIKEREIEEKNLLLNETHNVKLTLLGQMSSSFVHEFRNPLTAVIGFVKLLKTDYPTLKYIDIIDHELDQLKFRITQFLHTSKNDGAQEQRKELVQVEHLLDEIIKFLYPSIVDIDVNVVTNYDNSFLTVANKNELKQVFLNILMNSIDAVTKKEKPREIFVTTRIDQSFIAVDITNNGPMIPNETRAYIFEPFYTTKELGTGIGLFVCRKIIETHNGTISCQSSENQTTFTICLPITQK